MARPFNRRVAPGNAIFGRLFGPRARTSVIRDIEHLLATADRVSDVAVPDVVEVAKRHGVDLEQRLRTPRLSLYRRFFECCLLDQALSDEEFADLTHLRTLLRLEEADVVRTHDEVTCAVYGKAIDEVLEDQRLDPDEAAFLTRLRSELGLSDEVADRLYEEGGERARRRFLDRAVTRDDFLLSARDISLDLSGGSDSSLEEAIRSTVDEASRAVPGLRWVEIDRIGGDVQDGKVERWHIKLKAKRTPDE